MRHCGQRRKGIEVALEVGQEPQRLFALGVRALGRASTGQIEGARADAAAVLELADEQGVMIATILTSSALGLLELSLENHDAAHRVLGPLVDRLEEGGVREPGSTRFVPDDIEALIALGKLPEAELDSRSARAPRAAAGSRLDDRRRRACRGMLLAARGDTTGAIEESSSGRSGTMSGCRCRSNVDAHCSIGDATGEVEAGGARRIGGGGRDVAVDERELWTDFARAELARVGGRHSSSAELTPTERAVAELVADGRTDREVAAALFVTPKTVSTELSRIYRKLDIHSRTALAAWLRSEVDDRKV